MPNLVYNFKHISANLRPSTPFEIIKPIGFPMISEEKEFNSFKFT